MKILYLGGKTAGLVGLLTLLAKGHRPDVVAYTSDIALFVMANRLYSVEPIEDWDAAPWGYDLLISVHGRQIVRGDFLDDLPYGGINLHPCLWKYKGARPVHRAIEAGETKFSVGAHRMTEKVDEGEVLVEKFIEVDWSKTWAPVPEVYSHLYPLYSIVLAEALEKVIG